MLDIQVTVQGDKAVVTGLEKFAGEFPSAIGRGLERSAKGVHRETYAFLSEKGAKKSNAEAGGYPPVPVRTGHLRQLLDWLKPGESKSGPAGEFTAAMDEVVIYDSAEYAGVIHDGLGSSAKFGPRPYITDGLEKYNGGDRIKQNIEEEIEAEILKAGLK